MINDKLLSRIKNNIQNKIKTYFPQYVKVANVNVGKITNGIKIIIQLNIKGEFEQIEFGKLEDDLK
jgi:hypothetical protein